MWTNGQVWAISFLILVIIVCFVGPAILATNKKKVRIQNSDRTRSRDLTEGTLVYFRHAVVGMEGWHHNHVNVASAVIQKIRDDGTIDVMVRAPDGHFVDVSAKPDDLSYNPTNPDMLEAVRR